MLVECENCGAPLNVEPSARYVQCGYCDKSNKVKRMTTLAMRTPAEWKPPAVWTPHAGRPAPRVELRYHDTKQARTVIKSILIVVGVTTILPIVIWVFAMIVVVFVVIAGILSTWAAS